MKETTKIKLHAERIHELKLLEDGSYELLLEVEKDMKEHESTNENSSCPPILDSDLVLIDAENLSVVDKFLQHIPKNEMEEATKFLIILAIRKGVKNFYKPRGDVSFTDDESGICYAPGKMPAASKSYNWHEEAAKKFWPERDSRLGSKFEYGAFLGVLIKKLIEDGKTVEWAWNAVCCDSSELGHYRNSKIARHGFEPTGSREICGLCDLANVYKILAWDNEDDCLWFAGGSCVCRGDNNPLAKLCRGGGRNYVRNLGVSWLVLS